MLELSVPLVLASGSPRRKSLLAALGLEFEVDVPDISESLRTDLSLETALEDVALRKARAVAERRGMPRALILASDTTVVLDEQPLGKPRDAHEAEDMLRRLSNRSHVVISSLALMLPVEGRETTRHVQTVVHFAELTPAEIRRYVATGSPLDKAGAYGIQDDLGALFVAHIEGDYYNVVGLPLHTLYQTLKEDFGDLLLNARAPSLA